MHPLPLPINASELPLDLPAIAKPRTPRIFREICSNGWAQNPAQSRGGNREGAICRHSTCQGRSILWYPTLRPDDPSRPRWCGLAYKAHHPSRTPSKRPTRLFPSSRGCVRTRGWSRREYEIHELSFTTVVAGQRHLLSGVPPLFCAGREVPSRVPGRCHGLLLSDPWLACFPPGYRPIGRLGRGPPRHRVALLHQRKPRRPARACNAVALKSVAKVQNNLIILTH